MVLQTLVTMGPLHAYAIVARLEQVSGGAIRLNMGTLSPGLMRPEQQGLARGMAAPFLGTLRRSARDLETEEELRAHLALAAEQMESARRPQTPAAGPG